VAEPPSPTLTTGAHEVVVVGADEQDAMTVDVERWARLARAVALDEGGRGELTLTFVGPDDIAELNLEHLGHDGPTDVLSFPLDADDTPAPDGVPRLLGDVVVCPAVAARQADTHAGSLDDELALLVVHGVLHVLGHDHAHPDETRAMRARELEHLTRHHWHGDAPSAFQQEQQEHP